MLAAYKNLWHMVEILTMPFLVAFGAVVVLTPLMILIAQRFNILDFPNERKIHSLPTPRLGGLGILLAVWGAALTHLPWTHQFFSILVGGTLIAVMGIMDDIRPLSSRIRLLGQLVAAAIVMSSGLLVSFMPKVWWGQIGAILITATWILGIVNALNFADGLDGLASGMALIAAVFFFILSSYLNQSDVAFVAAIMAGACFGFLFYNFKPARIYLGDGGSTLLGFFLATIALYGGWSGEGVVVAFGIPTIILGVLIFDMIYITVARTVGGQVRTFQEWLDYAGTDHFHHRLLSIGFTELRAVVFIYLVCLILGLNVLVLERLRNPLSVAIVFINSILIFLVIFILMRVGHELRRKK